MKTWEKCDYKIKRPYEAFFTEMR